MLQKTLKISVAIFCVASLSAAEKADKREAAIQPQWQNKFYSEIEKMPEVEQAWTLYSYSGYSNNGQYAVVKMATKILVMHAKENEKDNFETRELSKENFALFLNSVSKAKDLENLEQLVFDGVQYEYVEYEHEKSGLLEKKRIFMNNPELMEKKDAHLDLLRAFYALKASDAKPKKKKKNAN